MLFSVLYDIAIWILAIISLPKMIYQMIAHKKYRQSLPQRFGLNFPKIEKGNKELVWIHAVSMGETKAVSALAKMIKNDKPNCLLVISNVTETGHAEAKRSIPFADHFVYLPLDASFIIRPIVERVSPNLLILTETDFWYNFLNASKNSGADIVLVNGKLSQRSMERHQKFPFFAKKLFSCINLFCVQNELYSTRFKSLGIRDEKIVVTGNLKFDTTDKPLSDSEKQAWKRELGIKEDSPVIVLGSSHHPEEKIVLDVMNQVWVECPKAKILIVPRHPERFEEVFSLMKGDGLSVVSWSKIRQKTGKEQAILIDAVGILRKCYQIADIAIVAGSYTEKVGGHNILEPCLYGVPVIFGPYMHTQAELVDLVKNYKAGIQLTPNNLAENLLILLKNPDKRKELGENGMRLMHEMQGSTLRTWQAISTGHN